MNGALGLDDRWSLHSVRTLRFTAMLLTATVLASLLCALPRFEFEDFHSSMRCAAWPSLRSGVPG